jgi:hypothetical protein
MKITQQYGEEGGGLCDGWISWSEPGILKG